MLFVVRDLVKEVALTFELQICGSTVPEEEKDRRKRKESQLSSESVKKNSFRKLVCGIRLESEHRP